MRAIHDPPIKRELLERGRGPPRKVAARAVAQQAEAPRFVAVPVQSAVEPLAGVRRELESITAARARIKVLDALVEPTNCAHDRHAEVSERIHLRKTAGLEFRGHQAEVAAGVMVPLARIRELRFEAHVPRVARLQRLEAPRDRGVALAHQYELHVL